jgi:hypothetical protein
VERETWSEDDTLEPGMRVEVATRFDGDWAAGFEVASTSVAGCRVRRVSDGSVLPFDFPHPCVRPAYR